MNTYKIYFSLPGISDYHYLIVGVINENLVSGVGEALCLNMNVQYQYWERA